MSEPRLVVDKVSKAFKSEQVLNSVSLEMEGNKIYGIVGRNGSGKSVLFKIIAGFIRADSGTVTYNGKVVGKDIDFPEDLGALIEAPGFLWYQSGMKNLEYLAGIHKKVGKAEIREVVRKVGLDPDSKKWVRKYSLGMKQRLGIAQAIMEDPKLLILDEPMNALDEEGVNQMRRLFSELRSEDRIIILASHNKEDIEALCDEVYEISGGKIRKME